FEKAAALNPRDTRARFFLGLLKKQAGDKSGALRDWTALLRDAGPGDEWTSELKTRIASLAKEMKVTLDPRLAIDPPMAEAAALSGPNAAEIEAAQAMPEEERNGMIRGMVDRLANRLAQSPQDKDGWIRLMRARKVLGDMDAAKDSYRQALLAFPRQQRGPRAAYGSGPRTGPHGPRPVIPAYRSTSAMEG
ncbi:MAG TPA: hypothetical protein VE986_00040, partial [Hyphomicrobiales bacterium]|nr:hypothetical protein [Hyphomicrobiales bacterium]